MKALLAAGLALAFACLIAACAPRAASPTELSQAASTRSSLNPGVGDFQGFVPTTEGPGGTTQRAPGTPDLVIIAFSGHCGIVCHTRNTWSYLDSASEATGGVAVLDAIADAYRGLGLEVEVFSASSFVTAHYSAISEEVEPGYLQAQAYLDEVKRELITGAVDPARVVLVGHSHGTVWASLLAMNNLDVTFDAFISLDAICWQWWARHKGFVAQAFVGGPWPLPYPLENGDPCNSLRVPGFDTTFDINDVFSANVIFGIEVRTQLRLLSLDPNVLADDDPNVRINGTTMNIWGIEATEAHSDLGRYYNQSIAWVSSMIGALGAPDHGEYPMYTFVLPPAPAEFGYQSGLVPTGDP